MNKISQYDGQCVRVMVDKLPNALTWVFEDGTEVQTDDLYLNERAGQVEIAVQAERLGLGDRRAIRRYLRGEHAVGRLLPMDDLGLDDDAGFPVV